MSTVHRLKTDPKSFQAIWSGQKLFNLRPDDRRFQVGDMLHLRELKHEVELLGDEVIYTGREMLLLVTHLLCGLEDRLPEDFVLMNIEHQTHMLNGNVLYGVGTEGETL